jgi:hypothetical protein
VERICISFDACEVLARLIDLSVILKATERGQPVYEACLSDGPSAIWGKFKIT